jgi:hypothetical protein
MFSWSALWFFFQNIVPTCCVLFDVTFGNPALFKFKNVLSYFFFNFSNQNLSAIFLWPILKRAVISSLPVITRLRILGAWELKFYVTTHIILRSDRSVWRQTAQRSPLCQFPVRRGTCILVHLKINFWVCLPCLKKRTRNVFVRLADTHDVYQTNRLLNIEVV